MPGTSQRKTNQNCSAMEASNMTQSPGAETGATCRILKLVDIAKSGSS